MPKLNELLNTFAKHNLRRMVAIEEQRRKDVEEFRAIDFFRATFDKEYNKRLDEHFGVGWEKRISYNFGFSTID